MPSLWLIALTSSTLSVAQPSGTSTRSLSLAEAVKLAMASEPAVASANIGRDRAELAAFRAQLDRFSVKVDAQLQELYAKTGIFSDQESFSGALGLSNISAGVTVPVFSGFRVESNVDRADKLEEAAVWDARTARREVALSVARAYWAVRKIALLREVQERALERLRGAEEIAASRVRAGLAPPIDENRAVSRRLLQEVALAELDGQLREAKASLAVALGVEAELELTEQPNLPAALPRSAAELLSSARSERPELASARARLDAQAAAVKIAQSDYYPQLSAYTLFQYGNNPSLAGVDSRSVSGAANPFSNMAGDFQAGLTLSINIFDTLNTQHAVKDARYEESRLAVEIERVERVVDGEVRTAREKVVRIYKMREKLSPALAVARDNVEIVQKRYENGEALVFELLDSEVELLNIERQLTESGSDLTLAWLELDASLGAVVGESL